MENQHKWLEHVYNVHETEQDMRLSWSAFYAAEIEDSHPVAICTMLPHLKATDRTKRGKGIRRRVDPSNRLPGNWGAFLRNDPNKEELFRYICTAVCNCELWGQRGFVNHGQPGVVQHTQKSWWPVSLYTWKGWHKAIITRSRLCTTRSQKIMLWTVDTDVVVLSTAIFKNLAIDEMWISFGMGKSWRYIPIQELVTILGPDRAKGLPVFHALTGCGQTSSFAGRGKVTAWDTWERYPDVTTAFKELSMTPTAETVERCQPLIERFVIQMYYRSSKFRYQWCTKRALHKKRQGYGRHSTNNGCLVWTHQTSRLSGGALLGANFKNRAKPAISRWMGLAEIWYSNMAAIVD